MAKLKLMTWNVLYSEKADNILSLIREINPDIFCAQELTSDSGFNPGRDVAEEIAATLGAQYEFQGATDITDEASGNRFIMGDAIFSKFPVLERRHTYIQKEDPHIKNYKAENRLYIEVELDIGGKGLKVGTTHLSYAPRFDMTEKKLAEAQKLYETIKGNTAGYVLTGDMNAEPNSEVIKKLRGMLQDAGPDGKEKTWTTKPFSYMGFEADTLDWRLDYIFTTPDIKVVSSRIIKTDYSDHLPILAEIEIT